MKRTSWSNANGVHDGYAFVCRECCDRAIADQYMPDIEGDIVENWLSNVNDEGYKPVIVANGVECDSCEKGAK